MTKIYSHVTFEQERFKINFILKNQVAGQNAIEKDFYKLINNANFGTTVEIILTTANLLPYLMS